MTGPCCCAAAPSSRAAASGRCPPASSNSARPPRKAPRARQWEEARVRLAFDGLLGVFSISRIGQVQLIFRARFADPGAASFAAGPETAEVRLFAWDSIPWGELAFPSVQWSLAAWRAGQGAPLGAPVGNPPADPRGEARVPGAATSPGGAL